MSIVILLMIVPFLCMIGFKYFAHTHYTWPEFGVHAAISIVSSLLLGLITYQYTFSGVRDYEILNGQVTKKYSERVSCTHSYQCNCVTQKTNNGTTTSCSTCYEHSYDVNWIVRSTIGDIKINRVNSRGNIEPGRFSIVNTGDPVSLESQYDNYIKASPDSIFNRQQYLDRFDHQLPDYPQVYDYYRMNHLLTDVPMSDVEYSLYNDEISHHLIVLGEEKKINIVIVVTGSSDPDYATALEYKWLGGKKNDMVIVLGAPDYPNVLWSKSFGWVENSRIHVVMQDVMTGSTLNPHDTINTISQVINDEYNGSSFEKFKYLLDEMEPPIWLVLIMMILNGCIAYGVSLYFMRTSHFD